MSDRDVVTEQLLKQKSSHFRQRVAQAQLQKIDRDLAAEEPPMEIDVKCPTPEAHQHLARYGYHWVAEGRFLYGEERKLIQQQLQQQQQAGAGDLHVAWWRGFGWCLLIACITFLWLHSRK
jgi:hypothetical protein